MEIIEIMDQMSAYYSIDPSISNLKFHMILKWIGENIPKEKRSEIFSKVNESFVPTTTNPYPAIVDFKNAMMPTPENLEREASEAFETILRKINIYMPLVLECPYAQAGLDAIGGWLELGNSAPDQMNWTRKGFIRAYIGAKKDGLIYPPKTYRGLADNPARVVMIGDQEKCQIAYDSNNLKLDFNILKQIENKTIN